MSGFTKGPWKTDPEAEHQCVIGSDGYLVADCAIFGSGDIADARSNSVCEANAHLIAAAPDMYEALKAIRELSGLDHWISGASAAVMSRMADIHQHSDAALASLQTGEGE